MKKEFVILIIVAWAAANANVSNAQWVKQNGGITGNFTDVAMLDTSTAIAVSHSGSILRTENAGETWLDVSLPMSYMGFWNAISFYDTSCGVLVGDDRAAFWTFDGGKGWMWGYIPNPRNCLCVENCLSVLCTGPGSCYVGTDSGIVYSTSDTGRTWDFVKISQWPIRDIFNYRIPVTGVSKFALTSHSLCVQYVVPPPNWGEVILSAFQGLGSEAFDAEYCNGGSVGFIVGVQGDFISSPAILRRRITDTGWQQLSTSGLGVGTLLSVSAPSADVIYVSGTNGMMYKSFDGGNTWSGQATGTAKNINAICFFNEKEGFAVGDSGLILHTSSGGLTAMDEKLGSVPEGLSLFQNYPNPFNPSTAISYQLSAVSHVTLEVFDVLGREVATLVNGKQTAGSHSVTFNANKLQSGVYFYRLSAVSLSGQPVKYTETKKLMLVK